MARHVEVIETDTKCIGFVENSFDKDNDDIEDSDLLVNMNNEELESREEELFVFPNPFYIFSW